MDPAADMAVQSVPDAAPPRRVDVTEAQGVYVGGGGIQVNLFTGEQPRSPVVAGNVPQPPPAFQPREDLLARLRAAGPGVSVVRAVTGMRGVGKTQLVAAYARECRAAGWRLVAWVNAEDAAGLLDGLAVLADRLGIGRDGKTLDAIGLEVRNRLEADGERCLIVFDNVTDFAVVRDYLPSVGNPHVILTTTDVGLSGSGKPLQVGVFSEQESLDFLAERTGLDDPADAKTLADELGCLPLALAQAAAVITAQHLTYPVYLGRLRDYPVEKYLPPTAGEPYPRSVAAAIALSIDTVASHPDGLCGPLLGVVSLLSPEGVSRDLLHAGASAGGFEGGPAEVDEALGRLAGASLLTFTSDDTVTAHRLVMRVVRERAAHAGALAGPAAQATDLLDAYERSLSEPWERRTGTREFVRQVTALADHLPLTPAHLEPSGLLALRGRALRCVLDLGDTPAQAVEMAEQLLADRERLIGPTHPDTLKTRSSLAVAYQTAGRIAEALPLHEAILTERERLLGPTHPDLLPARNNLACAYQAAGRTTEAVPLHEAVLTDSERLFGLTHPDTLMARRNLAYIYQAADRTAEAIPLHEAVLTDSKRLLGPTHPDTLIARHNLAHAYQAADRTAEAIPLSEAVLAGSEQLLGPAHPDTLTTRTNLASAYLNVGRTAEALRMFEDVLTDSERVLGPAHPETLTARHNLAYTYQAAGRTAEAIPLIEAILADSEQLLGATHPETLTARHNLAYTYRTAGRTAQAIQLHEAVLTDREQLLGATHIDTLVSRHNLAGAYLDAGRTAEAVVLLDQALAGFEKVLGMGHPTTAIVRKNLARTREDQ